MPEGRTITKTNKKLCLHRTYVLCQAIIYLRKDKQQGDKCHEEIYQVSTIAMYKGRGEFANIEGFTERVMHEQHL